MSALLAIAFMAFEPRFFECKASVPFRVKTTGSTYLVEVDPRKCREILPERLFADGFEVSHDPARA